MSHFKTEHKKLMITEVTLNIMEFFMGLNKKNELLLKIMAEKTSGKLVQEYCAAMKSQHRKIRKELFNPKQKTQTIIPVLQEDK